jgi:hypothetical protein
LAQVVPSGPVCWEQEKGAVPAVTNPAKAVSARRVKDFDDAIVRFVRKRDKGDVKE